MSGLPQAVLLDRDGTLNAKAPEGEYVHTAEQLVLLPGAAEALGRLNAAGLPVYLVTNQRGVALGRYSLDDVAALHEVLAVRLAESGAHLDGTYVCPHDRDACDCRKPLPGLAHQVLRDHPGLDLTAVVVIGDAESDVGLGRAIGARTIRLARPETGSAADQVVPDLAAAVTVLLTDGDTAP